MPDRAREMQFGKNTFFLQIPGGKNTSSCHGQQLEKTVVDMSLMSFSFIFMLLASTSTQATRHTEIKCRHIILHSIDIVLRHSW